MSEYINNVEKRKEVLKEVIFKLHQGQSVESLVEAYGDVIQNASAGEISNAEREMIAEGIPVQDIQRLCDLHVAVFQRALDEVPSPESQPGHPVYTFRMENEVIGRLLETIAELLDELKLGNMKALGSIKTSLKNLHQIEVHYDKKENLIFPYLEKHDFEGPSSVMWGVDNEIRTQMKSFVGLINSEPINLSEITEVFQEMEKAILDMIYKEDKILLTEALERLTPQEWEIIQMEFDRSYNMNDKEKTNKDLTAGDSYKNVSESPEGLLPLSTGALSLEQINLMLTNLPVDITYVDENDEVRYFSQTRERIFTRTAAIIGRKVQKCHPPQSVHKVQVIIDAFKAGSRDVAEFWIQMDGKFINIRYFPLRDKNGVYRGTIEVSQEVSHIRSLEGERRLLDD